jgi:hypothetical protein
MITGAAGNIENSIIRINELLTGITAAKTGLDDKVLKFSVLSQVERNQLEGLGRLIDTTA